MPVDAELPATFARRCFFGAVRREFCGGRMARFDGRFCNCDCGVLMLLDLVMSANMVCSEEEWERAEEEGLTLSLDASLQTRQAWSTARSQQAASVVVLPRQAWVCRWHAARTEHVPRLHARVRTVRLSRALDGSALPRTQSRARRVRAGPSVFNLSVSGCPPAHSEGLGRAPKNKFFCCF
jgi:hypothetical protein